MSPQKRYILYTESHQCGSCPVSCACLQGRGIDAQGTLRQSHAYILVCYHCWAVGFRFYHDMATLHLCLQLRFGQWQDPRPFGVIPSRSWIVNALWKKNANSTPDGINSRGAAGLYTFDNSCPRTGPTHPLNDALYWRIQRSTPERFKEQVLRRLKETAIHDCSLIGKCR